jgi:phage shock protein PspC (stress-responsive transcriptional regulator)
MTEILTERGIAANGVITVDDVTAIRAQLGEPRDFAEDSAEENSRETGNDSSASSDKIQTPKRYYRDEDNAMLGGVLAGLAAYMGWDLTLLRILTVILTIVPSFGTIIIAYIVVWIVAPAAKTTSEKLEMRGEPVNLDSIKESARKFGERAEEISKDLGEKGKEFGNKAKTWAQDTGNRYAPRAEEVSRKTSRVLLTVLAIIAGITVLATAIGIIFGTLFSGVALLVGTAVAVNEPALIVMISLGLAAGMSFGVGLFVLAISLFRQKFSRRSAAGLLSTLILALCFALAAVGVGVGWLANVGTVRAGETVNKIDESMRERFHYFAPQIKGWQGDDICIGICPRD